MDLTETIAPRSDQINADDLISGPRVVTIVDVRRGTTEQPVDVVTAEFGPGRPYKPSKSMRRVMVAAWGPDSTAYTGRQLMIYRDPAITFGKDAVGGIRISHLSDIDKPLKLALTVTRGRRSLHTVQPLPPQVAPEPERDWAEMVALAGTLDELRHVWQLARDAGALDQVGDLIADRHEALAGDTQEEAG